MSIVASVKVQDGIALGCDSATQITARDPQGNIGVLKIYQNAKKLYNFGKDVPLGVLTYGIGNIGAKSIRTIIKEFEKEHKFSPNKAYQVKNFAKNLLGFMKKAYEEEYSSIPSDEKPLLGLFIAGYSSNSSSGEEWEFTIPKDEKAKPLRPKEIFGSSWRGVSIPFTRLYYGHDPRATQEIQAIGVSADKLKKVYEKYKTSIIYDGMPVKDAINLVRFILHTTIGLQSFEIGAPSCSEPIQTAVIDEDGFKWIDKPTLT